MIDKEATGGRLVPALGSRITWDFPKGLSGAELAPRATAQAIRLGAEILTAQEVVSLRLEDPYRYVTLGDGTEIGSTLW